jgi:hypothetical protein
MLIEPPSDNGRDESSDDDAPTMTDVLRAALAPLVARIDAAFVYGPAARTVTAHGDIEIMIIGNGIEYADVLARLIAAAKYLGRSINPSVYSMDEWTRKLADGNRVLVAVLKQRRILVVGSDERIPQPR